MKSIGIYTAKNGTTYLCHFIKEDNYAYAIGPLSSNGADTPGIKFDVFAETEEEAKKKLAQIIDNSDFK